jgi:hypothetical protein
MKGNFDSGDSSIEELRPSLAALRLYDRAVDAAGLTERDTIEQAVVKLAKKQHVPVQRPKVQVNDPSGALKEVSSNLPPSLEIDCLEATVVRIETDLQNMQQRAVAWSVGDLDKLRALPFSNQRDVCITVISNSARMKALVDSAEQAWLDEAKAALNRNRVSFAMRPIYELLDGAGRSRNCWRKAIGSRGPTGNTNRVMRSGPAAHQACDFACSRIDQRVVRRSNVIGGEQRFDVGGTEGWTAQNP